MYKTLIICLLIVITFPLRAQSPAAEKVVCKLMGSRFEITAIADNKTTAQQAIQAGIDEITRIEKLISEWDPASQTSEINRNAGIKPVKVDSELFDLIYRSLKISELTEGAFDISFASMDRIWNFDKKEHELPDSNIVRTASALINWKDILIDPDKKMVFLAKPGMKIGFGAIGKGYAANRAKMNMGKISGVKGGVVNASGDLMAWGESNHANGWSVQIANPKDITKSLGWIRLNNLSIVTSGNYEKYFTSRGVRYAHIINPKTGYPVTGIKSVTIVSPDAELSDALATSVCVMGVEKGINLINRLNNVECLIIDSDDNLFTSDKLTLNYYK